MILEFLLNAVSFVIIGILSVIPAFTLPVSEMTSAFEYIHDLLESVGYFIPLDTLSVCLGVIIAVYVLKFIFSIINWATRKVPLVN